MEVKSAGFVDAELAKEMTDIMMQALKKKYPEMITTDKIYNNLYDKYYFMNIKQNPYRTNVEVGSAITDITLTDAYKRLAGKSMAHKGPIMMSDLTQVRITHVPTTAELMAEHCREVGEDENLGRRSRASGMMVDIHHMDMRENTAIRD